MGKGRASGAGRNGAARTGGGMDQAPSEGGELTRGDRSAVNDYTNFGFKNTNELLRTGDVTTMGKKDAAIREAKQLTEKLDKAFTRAPTLTGKTEVLRGVDSKAVAGWKVGQTVTDKGFVSTSTKAGSAFYQDKAVVIKINVPKGTKAIQPRTGNRREKELILNRGTKFKVKSITTKAHPTQGTQTIVSVDVVK
jgi:hypothetical protein